MAPEPANISSVDKAPASGTETRGPVFRRGPVEPRSFRSLSFSSSPCQGSIGATELNLVVRTEERHPAPPAPCARVHIHARVRKVVPFCKTFSVQKQSFCCCCLFFVTLSFTKTKPKITKARKCRCAFVSVAHQVTGAEK